MTKPLTWKMTPQKLKIGKYIAMGRTYKEAADKFGMAERTIKLWMSFREEDTNEMIFRDYVDKLTLSNEMNSKAGILRRLMNGVDVKSEFLEIDKNTALEYIKELTKLIVEEENKEDKVINIVIKNSSNDVEVEE